MLKCARGDGNSSDFGRPSSSSDGYESSSSGSDTGHISKRSNKECTLHCTCFGGRAHGKMHKGHKSRDIVSSRCRRYKHDTGLQHLQGIDEKFCRSNQSAKIACTRNKFHRKDPCNKRRAKRRKYEHWKPMDCSCKALSGGNSCRGDILDLSLGKQKPDKLVGDHHDTRKRRSDYTEESTCRKTDLPNLNLASSLEKSSTSQLDLTWKGGCLTGTPQENERLVDECSITDGEFFTHTPTRSTLSIQSAGKTGQSLLGSNIKEFTFIKYKEAEGSGVSTPQSRLQRTYEKFNNVLSCYEDLRMETKHLERQTKSFDLNVAVDEKIMLDASMASTLQSGILEQSLKNFQSLAPPNGFTTHKGDEVMLEAPPVSILEESCANYPMLTPPNALAHCKAKRKLFATNEESHFQRESLPESQKLYEEATMELCSKTQDEGIKMKKNSQEMHPLCTEREQECVKVSPRLMEEVIFEEIQDENRHIEQNKLISATNSAPNTEDNVMLVGLQGTGRKARKKQAICKESLVDFSTDEAGCVIADQQQACSVKLGGFESKVFPEIAEMVTENLSMINESMFQPQRWDNDILCNLCHRGTSLSLGEWYSCCCGSRLQDCSCGIVSSKYDNNEDSCSGKVHKMCALWSIKAYSEKGSFEGLSNIVARGKLLKCAKCQKHGATLTCVADNCTQVFHYPCADMLASKLRCRMRAGPQYFVACHEHQHDTRLREGAEVILNNLKIALERLPQRLGSSNASESPSSKEKGAAECDMQSNQFQNKDTTVHISCDSDDMPEVKCNASIQHCDSHNYKQQCGSTSNLSPLRQGCTIRRLHYFGNNILSQDISGGSEALLIPCTNDVDSTPAPNITYITRTRYLARAKSIFNSLFLKQENFALPCKGCSCVEMDDPHGKISCHHSPIDGHRHTDTRVDWQGQPMFGRLSYDQYGRLQAGPETDIVECNSRCPCDYACLNRELQKGLRLHLEVFRTEMQGWAVRTTEGIARGKFVVEFAGEILTHAEAHRRRGECNTSQLSCFSSPSHLDGSLEDLLVIDWYRMSNVACFLEPSCQGNLRMHRVYTQTKDTRFYSIGLYASRDIEIGEKLSYKSSNCFSCKHRTINFPLTNIRRTDQLMRSSE